MTGVDLTAGTADDYTIELKYHTDCGTADIVIRYFTPMDPDEEDTIGACASDIEQIDANNTVHFRVKNPVIGINPFIEINDTLKFDIIFGGDFESGDSSRWSVNLQDEAAFYENARRMDEPFPYPEQRNPHEAGSSLISGVLRVMLTTWRWRH